MLTIPRGQMEAGNSETAVDFGAMLNAVYLQDLLLTKEPVQDAVIPDPQAAQTEKVIRHVDKLVMNDV
jgi:hypothetical protein